MTEIILEGINFRCCCYAGASVYSRIVSMILLGILFEQFPRYELSRQALSLQQYYKKYYYYDSTPTRILVKTSCYMQNDVLLGADRNMTSLAVLPEFIPLSQDKSHIFFRITCTRTSLSAQYRKQFGFRFVVYITAKMLLKAHLRDALRFVWSLRKLSLTEESANSFFIAFVVTHLVRSAIFFFAAQRCFV